MVIVGVFVMDLGSTKDWTQQHSKRTVKLAVSAGRKLCMSPQPARLRVLLCATCYSGLHGADNTGYYGDEGLFVLCCKSVMLSLPLHRQLLLLARSNGLSNKGAIMACIQAAA
ncbi:hypothetical protein ABBQ32_007427 [Trebouxia sp. C0010 RCD-2024]